MYLYSYENGWVESEYETIWPKVHHAWADTRDTPQLFQFLNRYIITRNLYNIYQVEIYVRMFVFPIITYERLDRFASNFYRGTRENTGNVLSLVYKLKGIKSLPKTLLF